uniref:Uncharacterized protein n=1 Tax=Proboscia inermis TaxID=420281 RepID=A0A7S0CFR5_9STRA|mmetsp:Transcript_44802/g.45256  ORF Transcript_44802/g.45256 Transcript_44802/m.45256 type:complete len:116 (+) Transcript_44802:99-446(+)
MKPSIVFVSVTFTRSSPFLFVYYNLRNVEKPPRESLFVGMSTIAIASTSNERSMFGEKPCKTFDYKPTCFQNLPFHPKNACFVPRAKSSQILVDFQKLFQDEGGLLLPNVCVLFF